MHILFATILLTPHYGLQFEINENLLKISNFNLLESSIIYTVPKMREESKVSWTEIDHFTYRALTMDRQVVKKQEQIASKISGVLDIVAVSIVLYISCIKYLLILCDP